MFKAGIPRLPQPNARFDQKAALPQHSTQDLSRSRAVCWKLVTRYIETKIVDFILEQISALFEQLRQARLPLGVDQYLALLSALEMGFGQPDDEDEDPRAALKRLCWMIWLKSEEDQPLFDYHFDQIIKEFPVTTHAPQIDLASDDESIRSPDSLETTQVGKRRPEKQPQKDEPAPKTDVPQEDVEADDYGYNPKQAAEIAQVTDDVIDNAQSVLHLTSDDVEVSDERHFLATDYLPVTRRQMKQHWRYLRRMVREGAPVEIDLSATVRKVGRDGYLLDPVLRPRRVNRTALLLLVDQNGSMVPFHSLSRRLVETAAATDRLRQVGIFYFHNCPLVKPSPSPSNGQDPYRDHLLFQKAQCIDPKPVSEILTTFQGQHTSVLIFSDAGAARGGWHEARIQATATFIYQLKSHGINHIAWLNPMPRVPQDRWQETSAEVIASFVPMFSFDRHGLSEAIRVLRGQIRQVPDG